jgi:type I restriction enzyme S subunit
MRGKALFLQRSEKGNIKQLQLLSPTQKYGVIPQALYEQLSGMKAVKLDIGTDMSQLKTVHVGDYCISLRSFQGGFEYSDYEGIVSPAYQIFYPRVEVDRNFYKYLFKDQSFIAKMNSYTMSLRDGKNIAYSDFANSYIPVPPLTAQHRIADYLDQQCAAIDVVLDKTRASIEEYKNLKQSVITQAVTKGVRGDRPMKDSGIEWIGEIPAEWRMVKTNRICSTITDYVASGSFASLAENVEYLDEPDYAMLVRTIDVSGKGYSAKPVYINQHSYEFLSNSNLFGGEIMLPNIGASVGDVYIVPKLYERMSLAPNSIMVRTIGCDKFFYYYFMSSAGRQMIIDISQSTAQPKFNKTDFRQLKVVCPEIDEQKEISDYLDQKCSEIDILISKKEQFLAELEDYKKSLIYEYVTGKREVRL